MKIHLVLFHTKSAYGQEGYYDESVNRLINTFKENGGDEVHSYVEETLPFGNEDIKNYFEQYKNDAFGFYAFKPLIILDVMSKIPDGDVVLYHDAGRKEYNYSFKKNIRPLVNTVVDHYQGIGLCEGGWSHNQLTKDKCFKLMGCDTEYIRKKFQLAANWGIYEKNPKVLLFLNDWKKWCLNHEVVCSSIDEQNHEGFTRHTWDQSILTNLFHLYSLKTVPYVNHGWEKDINNFIGDYSIKVVNTFNDKEGLTLVTDIFYKYNKLHVLTTGVVKDVTLYYNNEYIKPSKTLLDPHGNNNCFQFDVEYRYHVRLNLEGIDNPIDNSNVSFIIKKEYYEDYPNEHVMSVVCHTSINSLDSIQTFIKYHLNLGCDKIIIYENGGNKFIELYNILREYINNNKVILKCFKNLKFYQKYRVNSPHVTNAGETIHMNQSLNIYKSSKYLSCFNLDEFIVPPLEVLNITSCLDNLVIKYNLQDKGGISIMPNDFGKPENGELFYKSNIVIPPVNNGPKVIHFPNNVNVTTCHSITSGNPTEYIDKNELSFNHYPFIDNNRPLGGEIGRLNNINYNFFTNNKKTNTMTLTELYYNTNTYYGDKGTDHDYINLYYNDEFNSKKNEQLNILEIGIWYGASIKLWNDFFPNSKIIGLDIQDNTNNTFTNNPQVTFIQTDAYLDSTISSFEDNYFDYIIEDGPHTLESQILCIQKYLPKVKSGGKVIIEDVQSIEWIEALENSIDKNIAESWRTIDMRESKGRWDDIIFEITKK
jgi:hypothetical protein